MSTGSGIERRRHPRVAILAQVRVKRGSVDYVMELSNISRSGALFSTGEMKRPTWCEPGRVLEINIIDPRDLDAIDVRGEIARVNQSARDTELAVRFVEMDAALQDRIDRFIETAVAGASRRPGPPPLPET